MDITVERDVFLKALTRTQSVVDKRHAMAVLTNLLLEAGNGQLSVMATDLEVSLKQRVPAHISSSGQCAASARTLFEIVREAPVTDIHMETSENHWLSLSYGSSKFKLMGIDPTQHPGMPVDNDGKAEESLEFTATALCDMIRKTLFAVSTDDTRSNLAGVYLDRGTTEGTIRLVATDGHRLAMVDRTAAGNVPSTGVILPRKGLNELGKLLSEYSGQVTLHIAGSEAVIELDDTILSMRLVEGTFPDYEKVVPEKATKLVRVDRNALLQTLRRVSILSSERARGVRFRLATGVLEITASNPDLGEATEDLVVEYDGEDLEVGFNARYLLDVLAVLPEESKVSIGLGDELSPGIVQGEDAGYRYVVMPMRI